MMRQRRAGHGGGSDVGGGIEASIGGGGDSNNDLPPQQDLEDGHDFLLISNAYGGGDPTTKTMDGKRNMKQKLVIQQQQKHKKIGDSRNKRRRHSSVTNFTSVQDVVQYLRQCFLRHRRHGSVSETLRSLASHAVEIIMNLTTVQIIVIVVGCLFLGLPLLLFVFSERKVLQENAIHYDVHACPANPPKQYPREYPVLDVLNAWPTDLLTLPNMNTPQQQQIVTGPHTAKYHHGGICVFDWSHRHLIKSGGSGSSSSSRHEHNEGGDDDDTQIWRKVQTYREAEVPFVVQGDPRVMEAVRKWSNELYLLRILSSNVDGAHEPQRYRTTIIRANETQTDRRVEPLSYQEWKDVVMVGGGGGGGGSDTTTVYSSFQLDACPPDANDKCHASYKNDPRYHDADIFWKDLPFFQSTDSKLTQNKNKKKHQLDEGQEFLYDLYGQPTTGISCKLKTPGYLTETQLDDQGGYYIVQLKGRARYLLGHPRNCNSLYLTQKRSSTDHQSPHLYKSQIHLKNWTQDAGDATSNHKNRVHNPSSSFHHHYHHKNHPQHPMFSESYPDFVDATMNQVVLEAGDVLFLPTHWIHHVVTLKSDDKDSDSGPNTVSYSASCSTATRHSNKHERLVKQCLTGAAVVDTGDIEEE